MEHILEIPDGDNAMLEYVKYFLRYAKYFVTSRY